MSIKSVFIIEPEATGHRIALYVDAIAEKLLINGYRVVLITSASSASHSSCSNLKSRLPLIFIEKISSLRKTKNRNIFYKQLHYYVNFKYAINECVKKYGDPHMIIYNSFDNIDKVSAVFGLPVKRIKSFCISIGPSFHLPYYGLATKRFTNRLKKYLFNLNIQRDDTCIGVIDELLVKYLSTNKFNNKRHVKYLPDPGEISGSLTQDQAKKFYGLENSDFVILIYGSLSARKGILEAINSVSRLLEHGIRVKLHLAGLPDYDTQIILNDDISIKLRLDKALIESLFFHTEKQEELAFKSCDMVWVAYKEPFLGSSGVLYQAASVGKPVLGNNVGLISYVIKKYQIGGCCDLNNTNDVDNQIMRLIETDCHSNKCGYNLNLLASKHTKIAFANSMYEAIEKS
jgi:glycosyltransferase involved in cell wall biosynthesis